ncbi:MAG: helix-turn-helix transcriptional regulator [Acidobacteria bacterium]|nr:helix-turn-helix transcriptional regulator [Acidobacteriota bacterium]
MTTKPPNRPARQAREPRFTASDRQRLERALETYLKRCYDGRTAARVTEFAAFLGIGRRHLTDVFNNIFGRAPRDILRDHQVEHACYLLRATPLSTADIAVASAFGTQMTFFRVFRQRMEMLPDEYRRQAAK